MVKKIVSIHKGNSRYENILNSLKPLKREIFKKLKNKKRIVIKPNCVSDSLQLASTHVDVIRAVLDFLKPLNKKIVIAEGSAYNTLRAFRNFNYFSLEKDYKIEMVDLNTDEYREIKGYGYGFKPVKLGIAKTMLESDFIISLALLKTHDSTLATFGIKNVAVGSLIKKTIFPHGISRIPLKKIRAIVNALVCTRNDKVKIHKGPKIINLNIFEIYKRIKPSLTIIDGWIGMEGNGPIDGTPVKMNLALASLDAVAADAVAAMLISLNPHKIGYLHYCLKYEKLNLKDIKVIGNTSLEKEQKKFKLHKNFRRQMRWKLREKDIKKLKKYNSGEIERIVK